MQRTLRCQYEIPSSPRISPECKDMLTNLIVKVLLESCRMQVDDEAHAAGSRRSLQPSSHAGIHLRMLKCPTRTPAIGINSQ